MAHVKKVRLGVIGGGMVSYRHLENFTVNRHTEVRWVCDIDPKALKKSQRTFNIPNATADYKEILGDKSVNAVLIATPPWLHAQMTIDALKAGKHVLLEKPVAANMRDVRRITAAVKRHPELHVVECSCRHARLQPKFDYIKKIIDSGKLGTVYMVHHNATARQTRPGVEYNPGASWFVNKKMAGAGPLLDWGVYDLSFHMGILGDRPQMKRVSSLTATNMDATPAKPAVYDVEEHGVALMEFTDGMKYYYERGNNPHCEVPNETRVYGTKGGLKFGYLSWDSPEVEYFFTDKNGRGIAKKKILKVNMSKHPGEFPPIVDHFVDVLRGRAKNKMPVERAAKHMGMLFKIVGAAEMVSG